jgi:hypothetical protein
VDIIVHLNGHADAVAFSDAETADQRDFISEIVFFDRILQKLDDFRRTFQMTGASYADLYNHLLHLRANRVFEEFFNRVGRNGVEFFVNHNADTLLALAEAEGSAEFHFIFELVFRYQLLELFNDLTGTLEVAGTSDANSDFHDVISLIV